MVDNFWFKFNDSDKFIIRQWVTHPKVFIKKTSNNAEIAQAFVTELFNNHLNKPADYHCTSEELLKCFKAQRQSILPEVLYEQEIISIDLILNYENPIYKLQIIGMSPVHSIYYYTTGNDTHLNISNIINEYYSAYGTYTYDNVELEQDIPLINHKFPIDNTIISLLFRTN